MTKLKPPPGHDSWLHFAISRMPTRDLLLIHSLSEGQSQWPETVSRMDLEEAVLTEYIELLDAAEKPIPAWIEKVRWGR